MTHRHHEIVASCALSIVRQGNDIQVFPAGAFNAPRGAMQGKGPWLIDQTIATALLNRVASRVNDILIDYEHQSLLSEKNGKEVPAAGWIGTTTLEWRDGKGLYALNPRWTDKAKQHIIQDEYRYLSPIFSYDRETGAVLDLVSIALTNTPALDGMDEVQYQAAAKELFGHVNECGENQLRLSDQEMAVCRATGVSPMDYQRTKISEKNTDETKLLFGLTMQEISICDQTGISYQEFAATKQTLR